MYVTCVNGFFFFFDVLKTVGIQTWQDLNYISRVETDGECESTRVSKLAQKHVHTRSYVHHNSQVTPAPPTNAHSGECNNHKTTTFHGHVQLICFTFCFLLQEE